MKKQFLQGSNESFLEGNIYADRSSIVLEWILKFGINRKTFSLREVSRDSGVSIGLVQKTFKTLVMYGFLEVEGVRTAKKFYLKNPKILLNSWINKYNI